MPPTPKAATPHSTNRYCGLGKHQLREPSKSIKQDGMLRFARQINPELRKSTLLCGACFDTLKIIYQSKLKSAIKLKKGSSRATVQTNSVSDVSCSQPQSQSLSVISAPSTTSSSASSTSLTTVNEVTSTSTAKRKRADSPDDDDDDDMISLNAVNGTRLPHIQPIPKRRPTVHLNSPAMDIYLAGTTGG